LNYYRKDAKEEDDKQYLNNINMFMSASDTAAGGSTRQSWMETSAFTGHMTQPTVSKHCRRIGS